MIDENVGALWQVAVDHRIEFGLPLIVHGQRNRGMNIAPTSRFGHQRGFNQPTQFFVPLNRSLRTKHASIGQMQQRSILKQLAEVGVDPQSIIKLRRRISIVDDGAIAAQLVHRNFSIPHVEPEWTIGGSIAGRNPIVVRPIIHTGIKIDQHVVNQILHVQLLLHRLIAGGSGKIRSSNQVDQFVPTI